PRGIGQQRPCSFSWTSNRKEATNELDRLQGTPRAARFRRSAPPLPRRGEGEGRPAAGLLPAADPRQAPRQAPLALVLLQPEKGDLPLLQLPGKRQRHRLRLPHGRARSREWAGRPNGGSAPPGAIRRPLVQRESEAITCKTGRGIR